MQQFAVYRNHNFRTRGMFPLVVDVQSDVFQDLHTCVVVPLTRAGPLGPFPLTYLTPSISFEGQLYVLMTPQLAGVARADLGSPVGNIAACERAILSALEFLMRGF